MSTVSAGCSIRSSRLRRVLLRSVAVMILLPLLHPQDASAAEGWRGVSPVAVDWVPPLPEAKSFLLKIEGKTDLTVSCKHEYKTFIFQDGLVIEELKSGKGVTTLLRMTAPPEAVNQLTMTLRRNQISTVPKNCTIGVFQPNAFIDYTVTWFGRSGRTNNFRVASFQPDERCPERAQTILDAINELQRIASTDPTAERVVIPSDRNCH